MPYIISLYERNLLVIRIELFCLFLQTQSFLSNTIPCHNHQASTYINIYILRLVHLKAQISN